MYLVTYSVHGGVATIRFKSLFDLRTFFRTASRETFDFLSVTCLVAGEGAADS